MFCPLLVFAQKKQIATARDLLKAGKELNKAEKSMRTLLEDSANRTKYKDLGSTLRCSDKAIRARQ